MATKKETGKIPVIVGVTGHRDLREQDVGYLKNAVRTELGSLQSQYPNSDIAVMTSLAEGADRLCAETALEMGLEIITVLPMPVSEYAEDFESDALKKLNELTERSSKAFIAPHKEPFTEGRDYLYRQAGLYIADHCHILFALWDGIPGEAGGCGTASIVQAKLRNLTNGAAGEQLRRADGTVVQIMTPRVSRDCVNMEAGRIIIHGDKSKSDEILRNTDSYNRDCADIADECMADDKIAAVYTASDRLSIINDIKDRRILIGLSVCAAVLTIAFLLYDEAEMHWMIILCGLMIISLFAINAFTRWTRFNAKYVEYRILAEACRVQTYLRTAGMNREAADILPWNLQVNIPWVSRAMSAIMTGERSGEKKSILDVWITGQKEYHKKALKKTELQLKRNDRLVTTALVITIGTYMAALLYEAVCCGMISGKSMFEPETNDAVRTAFKLLMGAFSALTLFANNYYGRLALPNVIDDHRKMALLYEEAEREIADKGEDESLLLRIAEDELCENANWYAYQRKHDEGLGI